MKQTTLLKSYLICVISCIGITLLLIGVRLINTNNWNKIDLSKVDCPKSNLIKIKDIEGNTFVFEDISENTNLKTNEITFKEVKLGIKSLATIEKSDPKINYLSKNEKISYKELLNLQNCYNQSTVLVSNKYNFTNAETNKFCSVIIKNENYEIDQCR